MSVVEGWVGDMLREMAHQTDARIRGVPYLTPRQRRGLAYWRGMPA